jgi:hypothetical protein
MWTFIRYCLHKCHVQCEALLYSYSHLSLITACRHEHLYYIQSNLNIKGTQGNLESVHYEQWSFICRLKLYALFMNRKNKATLYRQCFAIWRCPLSRFDRIYLDYSERKSHLWIYWCLWKAILSTFIATNNKKDLYTNIAICHVKGPLPIHL